MTPGRSSALRRVAMLAVLLAVPALAEDTGKGSDASAPEGSAANTGKPGEAPVDETAADEKTADADEKEALKVRWSLTPIGQYDWIDRDHDDNDDVTGLLRSVRVRSEQVERVSVPDRRERGLARPARRGGHAAPDVPAREPDLQPRRLGLAGRRPVLQPARVAPRPPAGLRPRPALPAHAHRGRARVPEHRRRRPALRRPERSPPALRCGADRLRRGAARAHGRAARLRGLAAPDRSARAVAARRLRGAQGRPPAPLPDRPHEPVARARTGPRPGGGRRGRRGCCWRPVACSRSTSTSTTSASARTSRRSCRARSAAASRRPTTPIDFIPDTDRYTGSARFRSQPRGASRARGGIPALRARAGARPHAHRGHRAACATTGSTTTRRTSPPTRTWSARSARTATSSSTSATTTSSATPRCSRTTTAARWTSSSTAGDGCTAGIEGVYRIDAGNRVALGGRYDVDPPRPRLRVAGLSAELLPGDPAR